MKKILKRSLSLFLAITIIFSSAIVGLGEIDFDGVFAVETHAANVNNLSFYFDNDLYGYVVYECEKGASGSLTIPSTYNGYSVKAIDRYAFYNCQYLTSVTIPNTVTEIYMGAFENCTKLTSVSLGSSVRNIDSDAFYDCVQLSSVTFPNSVKIIGQSSFQNCTNLKSVTIPNSVEHLGAYAFMNCTNLTNVTIGNGLSYINESSFEGCTKLNSVVIGNKVSVIYTYAFANCSKLATVTIPATVKDIGWGSFDGCSNLKKVYYSGTVYDRNYIYVSECNEDLFNAQWVYGTNSGVPATPKVTGANTLKGIDIKWNSIPGAVKYVVYKRLGTSSTWDIVATTTGTSYSDTNAPSAGSYYIYSVKAYNSANTPSNYEKAKTAVIQRVIAPYTKAANATNGINVTWGKVAGANKYVVLRRIGTESTWRIIGETTGTSFRDTNVNVGIYYIYSIRAVNGTGYSAYDVNKRFTIQYITAPTAVATNIIDGVNISWSGVRGATKYAVYRRQGGYSTWYLVGYTQSTSIRDYDVQNGIYYVYSIRAYNGSGYSAYNGNKTDTIQPIDTPDVYAYSELDAAVELYWDEVVGAKKYNIYRRTDYSSWKLIKTTTDTYYYDYEDIELEVDYYYAVRAVNGTGMSAYNYYKTDSVCCYSGGY